MFAKPLQQHQWLHQLTGDWKFTHECQMPDGTLSITEGVMNCRSLGGLWLVCESTGESPDGSKWSSIMTLGYDPTLNKYVGTFIGSMMANIWPYIGVLDATGKRLPLDSQGPKFTGDGIGNYRDTIEVIDADTWLFISEFQTDTGDWHQFMSGKHVRS
jgi:hypothetical protein